MNEDQEKFLGFITVFSVGYIMSFMTDSSISMYFVGLGTVALGTIYATVKNKEDDEK
jgi:uncharacterized membrane protein